MTNPAIPQTDAALLAAQAAAGEAGVTAYEAAKAEMVKARQSATSSAYAAAQSRGAPQGAIEAAFGDVNAMYDRRDAALTTAGAAYEDQMASRASRQQLYNDSVLEARSLIEDMAKRAVAPIDAQTRYAVAGIEAQGRMRVDEINAQRRLKELEMQAAAASRRGGGGGGGGGGGRSTKKKSLSEGELAGSMIDRAERSLGRARQSAEQAMRQTAEQSRQAGSYANMSSNYALREAMLRGNADDRQRDMAAEQARQAASYMGRAMNTEILGREWPGPLPQNDQFDSARSAFERTAQATRPQPTGIRPMLTRNQILDLAPGFRPGQSFITATQAAQFNQGPDALSLGAMLDGGGLQRIGAVAERLGLEQVDPTTYRPGAINPTTGLPYRRGDMTDLDARGVDAFRAAMVQAAIDMEAEGYDIDEAELANALDSGTDVYEPGDTAYDVALRRSGADGFEDLRSQAEEALRQAQAEQRELNDPLSDANWQRSQRELSLVDAATEAERRLIEDGMARDLGMVPQVPGLSIEQMDAVLAPQENYDRFKKALEDMATAKIDGAEWGDFYLDLVDAQLFNPATPSDVAMLAMLESMY